MDKEKEIKNSVELKYNYNQLKIFSFIIILINFFIIVIFSGVGFTKAFYYVIVIYNCLFLPIIIYFISSIFRIKKNIPNYVFQETLLDEPRPLFRGSMYFKVTIVNEKGEKINKNTKAIFYPSYVFGGLSFDDYFRKKVLVAYNPINEDVVVVKLIDSE